MQSRLRWMSHACRARRFSGSSESQTRAAPRRVKWGAEPFRTSATHGRFSLLLIGPECKFAVAQCVRRTHEWCAKGAVLEPRRARARQARACTPSSAERAALLDTPRCSTRALRVASALRTALTPTGNAAVAVLARSCSHWRHSAAAPGRPPRLTTCAKPCERVAAKNAATRIASA